MSALRVRYETMQLKKRYETHELLPGQTLHLLLLTQDAFGDWAASYPRDPWLPSTGYAMAQLYEELPGGTARDHAVALLVYVKSHFPKTSYATQSRAALHRGITSKPEPAWAAPTPPPAPSASTSPSPSASPTATPGKGQYAAWSQTQRASTIENETESSASAVSRHGLHANSLLE